MSVAETAVIALRTLSPELTLGLGTMLQLVPSQCWMSVRSLPVCVYVPTAHTSLGDTTATSLSSLRNGPTLGLGTTFHCVPSHRSISVRCGLCGLLYQPTAQPSVADTGATPRSRVS